MNIGLIKLLQKNGYAAARVYHIAKTGYDGKVEPFAQKVDPHKYKVVSIAKVPGSFCQQIQNQVTGKVDDTSVSVSSDDVAPDEIQAEGWGPDEYVLNSATITDDTLEINVSYGGCCEEHLFTLVSSGVFLESSPVRLRVSLA